MNSAKENILKKIRKALSTPVPLPFPDSEGDAAVFPPPADDLSVLFARAFTQLQGRFVFCSDTTELDRQLQQLLESKGWKNLYCNETPWQEKYSSSTDLAGCDASLTGCELLVARTGSIVLSSALQGGRTASVYAPVHICIARSSQLVYDIKDALLVLKEKYAGQLPSFISFASGPSRTADIEKTLVTGVHGPKEVYVFLVEG